MAKDQFTREWIIKTAIPIIETYSTSLTLRALHYRLVAAGMHNTIQHYKRVIAAMTKARWDGDVEFSAFSDHEREMMGETDYDQTNVDSAVSGSLGSIRYWLNNYYKNRWENQPIYPEVFIEKKALQGVFEGPCRDWDIALCPCKGYPSLTYMNDAADRFIEARDRGKIPVVLYFGDYDPSGEDIPRSIGETLYKMGVEVEIRRIALMEHQVIEWQLPPAPAKKTDSRTANWDGLGQVELDAVEPNQLQEMVNDAIEGVFDHDLYAELKAIESEERTEYRRKMQKGVNEFFDEDEE